MARRHSLSTLGVGLAVGFCILLVLFSIAWFLSARINSGFNKAVANALQPRGPDLSPDFTLRELTMRGGVHTVSFSPDGKYLAAGSLDACWDNDGGRWVADLVIWEVEDQQKFFEHRIHQSVKKVAFSRDGRVLAAAFSTAEFNPLTKDADVAILYQFPEMKELQRFPVSGQLETLSLSDDGQQVALLVMRKSRPLESRYEIELTRIGEDTNRIVLKNAQTTEVMDQTTMQFNRDGRFLCCVLDNQDQKVDTDLGISKGGFRQDVRGPFGPILQPLRLRCDPSTDRGSIPRPARRASRSPPREHGG